MSSPTKVVLAYSGGLDTSVIVKWLALQGHEVICVVVDVGVRIDEAALRAKAIASGAKKLVVVDAREEFARDFIFRAVQWNARYEGRYLLGTSLARPVIGRHLVEVARAEGATTISHGATGKGNDQIRFELTAHALMPGVKVIAPWRDPAFYKVIKGREDAIEYARQHGIPIKASASQPWSTDDNLMHISYEAGILEDPARRPPDELCEWTTDPRRAPDTPEAVSVEFERGVPVRVNGEALSPAALITRLNEAGARHGVGRLDLVESRHVGMKSRGVYETPGGTILLEAHRDLETLTTERGVIHLKETLMPRFAQLTYFGFWYCPEMECLDAFLGASQRFVSGRVDMELYKGSVRIVGRTSPHSLYDDRIASMSDDGGAYDPRDATGFISLLSLPLRVEAARRARAGEPGYALDRGA